MSLKVFINEEFVLQHEREVFDTISDLLFEEYSESIEPAILLGNFICYGNSIDAAFIKSDAFIIIEFKNYGGKIEFKENGHWFAENCRIETKPYINPFEQVKNYRNKICDFINDSNLTNNQNVDWRKFVNSLIVFHNPISLSNIPNTFFSKNPWFRITDVNNFIKTANQITSSEVKLNENQILSIPYKLGLQIRKNRKQKALEDSPIKAIEDLLFSIMVLKDMLEAKSLFSNEFDLIVNYNKEFNNNNASVTKNKLIEQNIKKCKLFDFKKDELNKLIENKIEKQILLVLNNNTRCNYLIDEIIKNKLNIKLLKDISNINNIINKLNKKYNRSIGNLPFNFDKLKAIELFTYQRGIFSYTLFEIIRLEFIKIRPIIKYLHAIFEILRTWFAEDMILHWYDRNSKNPFTNKIQRKRVEHAYAYGFSMEWFDNLKKRFEEKDLKYFLIQNEKFSRYAIIEKVEIPLRIKSVFKSIIDSMKNHLSEDELDDILSFLKLNWIKKDLLSLEDLYILELRTNFVFNFTSDLEFVSIVQCPESPPNSVIYEPVYISALEAIGNWGYGKILDEELLKNSLDYIENDDLKNDIIRITELWYPYKPTYNYANYTLTNRIYLKPYEYYNVNIGLNVSKELNKSPEELHNLLIKFNENKLYGKINDYYIGNRYYILLLKSNSKQLELNKINELQNDIKPISFSDKTINSISDKTINLELQNDIIGYSDIKQEFIDLAELIKSPDKCKLYGLDKIGGILLYGPPGCGKTYWANWFAECLSLKLYEITRSDYASSFVSGELQGIKDRINKIPKNNPSVLFFDEFDDIGAQRKNNTASDNENNKVVQYLLQEIPKLIQNGIIIIAATNFLKNLDTALIRAGRFDKKEPIFPPMPEERSEILYYSLIKNLPSNSPLINILKKVGADELEYWKPFGEKMKLFSNSYVIQTSKEIKQAIINTITKGDDIDEISFYETINNAIELVSNNISIKERKDFLNFLIDLEENKFNKYPHRIEVLKKEINIFFGDKRKNNRNPIGFKLDFDTP